MFAFLEVEFVVTYASAAGTNRVRRRSIRPIFGFQLVRTDRTPPLSQKPRIVGREPRRGGP